MHSTAAIQALDREMQISPIQVQGLSGGTYTEPGQGSHFAEKYSDIVNIGDPRGQALNDQPVMAYPINTPLQ